MLTRLQVDGFKNLRQVDLRFGPLTCIAGHNGVGKSNLFDAIALLSDLASMPLVKAATRVRGTDGRLSGIAQLFGRDRDALPCIRITAEMTVPRQVHDDFDRAAETTATCLRDTVALTLRKEAGAQEGPTLHLLDEELVALGLEAAARSFKFQPGKTWLAKYLKSPRSRTTPLIETLPEGAIKLLGDKDGKGGRPFAVPADKSPQTVLAGVNASTHPTVLAARREMQSWRMLQLEPTALRAPDEFSGENHLSPTGGPLPNTLKRVGCHAELANLLSDLIPGVLRIDVDSDEARQRRILRVTLRDRHPYDASSLLDGTLRFIALGLPGLDPLATGLTCLEEPENSMHPQRIPDVMRLVQGLAEDLPADDPDQPALLTTSPRQVIINTHSPLVVRDLDDDTLLMSDTQRQQAREWVTFKPLADTWRADGLARTAVVSTGLLTAYLGDDPVRLPRLSGKRTVRDHLQPDPTHGAVCSAVFHRAARTVAIRRLEAQVQQRFHH